MLLMSRDIKFRGWDSVNEVMLPVESINFREGYISLNEGDNSLTDTLEMIELMQYTGLKDKNGKEIYEGDILRCKCLKKCKLDSCAEKVIQYKNSIIEWWESGCNLGYRLRDSKGKTMMIKPTHLRTMEVEVIGNIYENPELLEGER